MLRGDRSGVGLPMIPAWLHVLSVAFVLSGLVGGMVVIADLFGHPQKMWIINIVWPLTALYAGLLGVWMYFCDRAPPGETA